MTWFEEPVTSDDHGGLASLRESLPQDVAAGEYGYALSYFADLCADRCVDCVQIDAGRCGGYTEWLRIAALAASYNLEVSAHCGPTLHRAVAPAAPNLRHLEYFHDHVRLEDLFFEGVARARQGSVIEVSAEPGIGICLKAPDVDQYRVA